METNVPVYMGWTPIAGDNPPAMMWTYHYVGGVIDSIDCNVCNVKIRNTPYAPVLWAYYRHFVSLEHTENAMFFTGSQQVSTNNSYPANAREENAQETRRPGTGSASCSMCPESFACAAELHSHMSSHFWKRFVRGFTMSVSESSEEPRESNQHDQKSLELLEEDFEFERKKSPYLLNDGENSMMRKPLDVELDQEVNIYEVDTQRRADLQLGVLLSFAIDKDNIYCLVCRKCVHNSVQKFYEHLRSVIHLDYLQEMVEDHKKFKDYPSQLSDLALAHEYMEQVSDNDVQCHACGTSLSNEELILNQHIQEPSHAESWSSLGSKAPESFTALYSRMEANFYNVHKYWCVICQKMTSVEFEFRQHLTTQTHQAKILAFDQESLIFDYCAICATLWYGFMKTFFYHSTCKMHKNMTANPYLTTRLPQRAERLLYASESKISEFLDRVDTRRIDDKKEEEQVIRNLEKLARQKYSHAAAYPLGSRISGLAGKNSNLDIFLDCSSNKCQVYNGNNSNDRQVLTRLEHIKQCLAGDRQNWHISACTLNSRMPILKVIHNPTGIECDISFTNGLTVESTRIINAYCKHYPNCRKLIIFLKNWMGHCDLTGQNGINTYGIAWLVIYFLQVVSILPTVSELISVHNKSAIIAGWETGASTYFQPCVTDQSFRELLMQFFKFYAVFDFRNYVICPLLGNSIRKIHFSKPTTLPSNMKPYLDYLNAVDEPEPFRVDSILCVQDPFDLADNITKAVQKSTVCNLKTLCSLSAQVLDDNS
ncbi:uncharacterized protein LOC135162940 [Diachasmimorpha longicaudata]|uniref:uncharacterized protein LOC135162940 n=1 Tax=Diachasmimorpha longicaudata TaxID=58733 RepID=UPI0030B8CC4E